MTAEPAGFNELSAAREMTDWLPDAYSVLYNVVLGALHNEGDGPDAQAAATAFDEFAAAGKAKLQGAIGKGVSTRNESATIAKADTSWQRGIL